MTAMSKPMIIDAQLHEPAVSLPWTNADDATRNDVMLELQIGWMRSVGVERALLFPVDLEWGLLAARMRPDMFAVVARVWSDGRECMDAGAPDIEDRIAEAAAHEGVVGVRIGGVRTGPHSSPELPVAAFDRVISACLEHGLTLFMLGFGDFESTRHVAQRYPELTVVVDHLAMPQPPGFSRDSPPLRSFPDLLELSSLPNIVLKVSGFPTLSEERYPFFDLAPRLRTLVGEFGADRLMWGSDISRIEGQIGFDMHLTSEPYPGKHSYAEALFYILHNEELSCEEREMILGGTIQRLLGWPGEPQQAMPAAASLRD
jgi:L-fuconolactonase